MTPPPTDKAAVPPVVPEQPQMPSTSERAVKDTARQLAAQLVVGATAVVFAAWLNRLLPARELAVWPICMSLGTIVSGLGSFGLGDTFVRVVPAHLAHGRRDEAGRLLRTGLLMNFVGCALLGVGVYVAASVAARYLLHDPAQTQLVRTMSLAAFFIAFGERTQWALQAVQEFGHRAWINGITGVLRTPLALGLYLLVGGPYGVVLALTIVPALGCLLSLMWLRKHLSHGSGFQAPQAVLRLSLPFYGVALLGMLNGRVNQIIIALLVTPEVLATYFVASSISGYLIALNRFALEATTPKLAERGALATHADEPVAVFRKCTRYLFLGLTPLHVLTAAAATPLMLLYGGEQYAHGGPILAILCIGALVWTLALLQRAHMIAFSRPLHVFAYGVVDSIANIGLLVWLVPLLGALGAALNDLALALVALALSAVMLRRTMRGPYDLPALGLALVASAAGAAVMWALRPVWQATPAMVLPVLLLAGAAYGLTLARRLKQSDVDLVVRCLPLRLRCSRPGQAFSYGLHWLWRAPSGQGEIPTIGSPEVCP